MASFASPDAPTVIAAGDKIPACEMHDGFPGVKGDAAKVMTDELCKGARAIPRADPAAARFFNARFFCPPRARAGKKVVIMGLPGAFTPCWSGVQVPGYLAQQEALKAKGIAAVYVYCVNDGAVMTGWAKDQGIEGSMITFLADTTCAFTRAVGMVLDHPGPMGALGTPRCKRFVLVVDDGVVTHVEVSEAEGDPAGDNEPEGPVTAKTRVEHILTLL